MAAAPAGRSAQTTLYMRGLDDRVRKEELRRTIHLLCLEFGPVVDVSLAKTKAARGQAWVTFADAQAAVTARQQLDGAEMYGRKIEARPAKAASAVSDPSVLRKASAKRGAA